MAAQFMKITDVLKSLDESDDTSTEKTASEATSKSDVRNELVEILLRGKGAADGTEKVASTGPTQDLEKIASDLAEAEQDAMTKEAQLYGAAVCDGFMARLSQYEEAAGYIQQHEPEKTAEVAEAEEEVEEEEIDLSGVEPEAIHMANQLIKQASDNGEELGGREALEKVAQHYYDGGYGHVMEKAVEAMYEMGFEGVMEKAAADLEAATTQEEVQKTAELVYNSAFEETLEKCAEALHAAGETDVVEELTKVAFDCGYEDAMEKIASAAYSQGFNDMQQLLDSVA